MIWCVEDDAGIREIESYALRSAGFETKEFELLRNFLSHPGKVYAREQLFCRLRKVS